jgi:hypothetical protein
MNSPLLPVPRLTGGAVAVEPPGEGAGNWAGAPSAVMVDGVVHLAYRVRAPLGQGRGLAVVLARSQDGVRFETVGEVTKDRFGAESLERPALLRTAEGRWRLFVSCATPGSKHWWVDVLEADTLEGLADAPRRTVLPGDHRHAVKDPVIVLDDGTWHLWASVHPLDDPDATDRMRTDYATSADGLIWAWQGTALAPRPGEWDARGVRVAAVRFGDEGVTAFYDGRATAEQNCEERTGIADGLEPGALTAVGTTCVGEAGHAGFGLRYLTVVDLGDGYERLYYELTNANGSHDLVTELRPAAMTADVAAAVDAEQATAA